MCVVGDYAEPGVSRVLFHNPPQGHLRRVGHGIGFVEDDELEAGDAAGPRCTADGEYLFGGSERLDLLAHNVDAAVVGGVELEHHLSHVVLAVYAPGEGQDGRRLPGAGGAVEQEVWQPIRVDEFVDGCEDVLVARDVAQRHRPVLLDPCCPQVSTCICREVARSFLSLPRQGILGFNGQIGSTSLAFGRVLGREYDVIGRRTVDVHFILEVGHGGGGQRQCGLCNSCAGFEYTSGGQLRRFVCW